MAITLLNRVGKFWQRGDEARLEQAGLPASRFVAARYPPAIISATRRPPTRDVDHRSPKAIHQAA